MTSVFIISAPSGSGKSTLVKAVREWDPSLRFSISYTTRPPRGQERPGESYHYLTEAEFLARIERDEFLEFARVFGYYYGTHRGVLEEAN
jgi:guanylate kinase